MLTVAIEPLPFGYHKHVVIDCTMPVILAHRDGRYALVSPCATEPGRWRVTRFDSAGPTGHATRATAIEAAQAAMDDGFVEILGFPGEVYNG